jgi:hypothetical protein
MATKNLEEYLDGDYTRDTKDIEDIEALIEDVARTLTHHFDRKTAWPYQFQDGAVSYAKDLSDSTTAMIMLSLMRLCGKVRITQFARATPARQFPAPKLPRELYTDIDKLTFDGLTLLTRSDPQELSKSGTWGCNDPLTAAWLAEICLASWSKEPPIGAQKSGKELAASLKDNILKFFAGERHEKSCDSRDIKCWTRVEKDSGLDLKPEILDHVLFDLRLIVVKQIFGPLDQGLIQGYRAKFEGRLHDQLSFSSIPDSRFDPAELAFCLEGLLMVQPDAVDAALFERVVAVLTEAQQRSAHWRPVKPLIATQRGFVIFPVSVEVANSILRSCVIMSSREIHENFDGLTLPLFRRYWQWLRARVVKFECSDKKYVGWHSEHVNRPELIHTWETSQVVEFMLGYRHLLQDHVARKTLKLSHLDEKAPKSRKGTTDLMSRWEKIEQQYEPVVSLGKNYQIYRRIGEDFISDRAHGAPENYSLMLYGPPGTGKTTIAGNIAEALGYRLITVTVSDFLDGGEAQIEARAKRVFQVLQEQTEAVVLFDEIDNFLLDRNSIRYGDQDTLYQFMTPGMLTKLNDLRRSKRVLFVIATNYENRIDAAIKRTGRVDKRYLVLPPDTIGRTKIMQNFLSEEFKELAPTFDDATGSYARDTLFMGYPDLKVAFDHARRENFRITKQEHPTASKEEIEGLLASGIVAKIIVAVREVAATTRIEAYQGQFEENGPFEEFFCLAALAEGANSEKWASVKAAKEAHDALQPYSDLKHAIRSKALFIPEPLLQKIADRLKSPADGSAE